MITGKNKAEAILQQALADKDLPELPNDSLRNSKIDIEKELDGSDEDILSINQISNNENEVDDDDEIMSNEEKAKRPKISSDSCYMIHYISKDVLPIGLVLKIF